MIDRKRWQLISDDSVWMFPPDVTLSTVELVEDCSQLYRIYFDEKPYESCLFFANGHSDVIARYLTQEEALAGHVELEKKYGLKRCTKLKVPL